MPRLCLCRIPDTRHSNIEDYSVISTLNDSRLFIKIVLNKCSVQYAHMIKLHVFLQFEAVVDVADKKNIYRQWFLLIISTYKDVSSLGFGSWISISNSSNSLLFYLSLNLCLDGLKLGEIEGTYYFSKCVRVEYFLF